MEITLLSYHCYKSKRKASMHFIADALAKMGHKVNFITTGLSLLSAIKHDPRFHTAKNKKSANRWIKDENSSVQYYNWIRLIHAARSNQPEIAKIIHPLLRKISTNAPCDITKRLIQSDLIISESCHGLGLLLNSAITTPAIYRVNDDLDEIDAGLTLKSIEQELLEQKRFSLVSIPVETFSKKFTAKGIQPILLKHGIDTSAFDTANENPYPKGTKNAIFVGMSMLDMETIKTITDNLPALNIHIFGPFRDEIKKPNCTFYGEVAFKETIPYIQHADIGLQTRSATEQHLRHSLKIQQYTYCNLKILGPDILDTGWGNYFGYTREDEDSILAASHAALQACARKEQATASAPCIADWAQVTQTLLEQFAASQHPATCRAA